VRSPSLHRVPADTGPYQTRGPASPRPRVAFLPIEAPAPLVAGIAQRLRDRLGLETEVLPPLQPDAQSRDAERQQLVAEPLAQQIHREQSARVRSGDVFVIGITGQDMYMRSNLRWRFAFSYRLPPAIAVVSYARMKAPRPGATDPEDLLRSRLLKMVAKDVGVLVYKLPMSKDPKSLLFDGILGVDELDFIEENFDRAGMARAGDR
jgi:predicted Zn-dependent protease